MANKKLAKKKQGDQGPASKQEEELLKHPVMANPPFSMAMVTANAIPFYDQPSAAGKMVGEAGKKEVIPILYADGEWLLTVCRYEEAWIQAAYVEEIAQDSPDVAARLTVEAAHL